MKGKLTTDKMFETVLAVIFGMYIIINAFVSQVATWTSDLSDVDGTDYGWIVGLVALALLSALVIKAYKGSKH